MTEAEWWAATKPDPLLDWLFYERLGSTRKFRLFWVAACRELSSLVPNYPELVELLDLIEQSPDSEVIIDRSVELYRPAHERVPSDERSVELYRAGYDRVSSRGPYRSDDSVWNTYLAVVLSAGTDAGSPWLEPEHRDQSREDRSHWRNPEPTPRDVTKYCSRATSGRSAPRHVRLLHDIFGPLPFRDVAIAPAWLTSDVMLLARGIYEEKAFDRMPILADALQDAGCDNDEILSHCRAQKWEHVRGCWVIDLLLGKPWCEAQSAGT